MYEPVKCLRIYMTLNRFRCKANKLNVKFLAPIMCVFEETHIYMVHDTC